MQREYRARYPHKRREHYLRNKAQVLAQAAIYRAAHKDEERENRARHYQRNKEHVARVTKAYREAHPELYAQAYAKRRATKRNATPLWVDHAEIGAIYAKAARLTYETGIPHEVDHVYPLQGKTSCGLHVPWNLKVVTRTENRSKTNNLPGIAAA